MTILLDENLERLAPRLRMICNSDAEVNTLRSALSGSVRSQVKAARRYRPVESLARACREEPAEEDSGTEREALDDAVGPEARVACFIRFDTATTPLEGLPQTGRNRRGEIATADLTPRQIQEIASKAQERGIQYLETGNPLAAPNPQRSRVRAREPWSRAPQGAIEPVEPQVLVGLVDVGGFDFSHPDFLDDQGGTRFVRIWDQGALPGQTPGKPPADFRYGAELTQESMNAALRGATTAGVDATDLLPQTGQVPGSHGTHVASIAAGNSGVCPRAAVAGVLLALTEDETHRHRTLFDSTRLAHAVDYLFALGDELRLPTVVNISLGTNGHAHDGSSPVSRWIDAALDRPGRVVCVAAGNAGQQAPQFEGDLGFLMGRIHASGTIAARGLEAGLEWQVVGNGRTDVSENELEIWYPAGDELEVLLRPPSGGWIGPVRPGEYMENEPLPSGTFFSIYNEQYHPANGDNRISIFLSPCLKEPVIGIEAGTWEVRLRGVEIRDGRYDAWIERDDPRRLGRVGEAETWRFPSYFSAGSNVDGFSVSSLACGHLVISVANCDTEAERVNPSSSQGPTRDGRRKPEIAAPGTDVVAARGFSSPERPWLALSGTSMASPFVAGLAAQMLTLRPSLTAPQVHRLFRPLDVGKPGRSERMEDGR
jgi:subtilisin family serine protease